ncbi:FAD-binding oxidoreductase [Pengzhenrongella sicca]|uniref:FAD-binding oxidoreductase n=1 Tax=Pengzhenrongella sicca TaxID=2819238 RepID=A0A8A4Z7C1_9MICO|nr:FAD-binding oxidoreductase [Pengzhenrongella sicca]QTE27790.1 FAD-binding oxidoreductase [Pengzhenrongella sicca]
MTTVQTAPNAATPDDLRRRLAGRVIDPGDPDYDTLRAMPTGGVDARPAMIARPVSDADVAEVIRFARASGLALAVRSGGHSGAAHSTAEGGLVLDLRDLTAVEIDPGDRTVWAEAGLTARELTAAVAAHGLVIGFGDTGSVGISGITLGGGVGFLSRLHGLTIDNLIAADVVTADGRVLRVHEHAHPELFWALRGGGGNFGVVTRFRYRLRALTDVVGGMLLLPATAQTVAGFVAAAQAAPRELTTIANVMPCPPLPFVPAEQHGQLVLMGLLCFAGSAADAEWALAPFRTLADPLADLLRPQPYPELFGPEPDGPRPTAVVRTMFVDEVGPERAATVVDRLRTSDAAMRVAQFRVLGGAIAQVGAGDTAYAHRSSQIMVNVAAVYDGATERAARTAWVQEVAGQLDQGDPGAYVNFLGDEGPDRVRAAYPGSTWDRLAAVKATYDPTNLFRRNQNVPPPTSEPGD